MAAPGSVSAREPIRPFQWEEETRTIVLPASGFLRWRSPEASLQVSLSKYSWQVLQNAALPDLEEGASITLTKANTVALNRLLGFGRDEKGILSRLRCESTDQAASIAKHLLKVAALLSLAEQSPWPELADALRDGRHMFAHLSRTVYKIYIRDHTPGAIPHVFVEEEEREDDGLRSRCYCINTQQWYPLYRGEGPRGRDDGRVIWDNREAPAKNDAFQIVGPLETLPPVTHQSVCLVYLPLSDGNWRSARWRVEPETLYNLPILRWEGLQEGAEWHQFRVDPNSAIPLASVAGRIGSADTLVTLWRIGSALERAGFQGYVGMLLEQFVTNDFRPGGWCPTTEEGRFLRLCRANVGSRDYYLEIKEEVDERPWRTFVNLTTLQRNSGVPVVSAERVEGPNLRSYGGVEATCIPVSLEGADGVQFLVEADSDPGSPTLEAFLELVEGLLTALNRGDGVALSLYSRPQIAEIGSGYLVAYVPGQQEIDDHRGILLLLLKLMQRLEVAPRLSSDLARLLRENESDEVLPIDYRCFLERLPGLLGGFARSHSFGADDDSISINPRGSVGVMLDGFSAPLGRFAVRLGVVDRTPVLVLVPARHRGSLTFASYAELSHFVQQLLPSLVAMKRNPQEEVWFRGEPVQQSIAYVAKARIGSEQTSLVYLTIGEHEERDQIEGRLEGESFAAPHFFSLEELPAVLTRIRERFNSVCVLQRELYEHSRQPEHQLPYGCRYTLAETDLGRYEMAVGLFRRRRKIRFNVSVRYREEGAMIEVGESDSDSVRARFSTVDELREALATDVSDGEARLLPPDMKREGLALLTSESRVMEAYDWVDLHNRDRIDPAASRIALRTLAVNLPLHYYLNWFAGSSFSAQARASAFWPAVHEYYEFRTERVPGEQNFQPDDPCAVCRDPCEEVGSGAHCKCDAPICLGCTQQWFAVNHEPVCPTGCEKILSTQDLMKLDLEAERLEELLTRKTERLLEAEPGWKYCTDARCPGGMVQIETVDDAGCLVCGTHFFESRVSPTRVALARELVDNLGTYAPDAPCTRECFHCGETMERQDACPHIAPGQFPGQCACPDWSVITGAYPSDNYHWNDRSQYYVPSGGLLTDLGFYEGLAPGEYGAPVTQLIYERHGIDAHEWLAICIDRVRQEEDG